jgi:hypothetical protein
MIVARWRAGRFFRRRSSRFLGTASLVHRDDLYHLGLGVPQAHLIAHDLVFHGIFERGVEQHLDLLALDESHLDNALAKASMTRHLDDDAALACM